MTIEKALEYAISLIKNPTEQMKIEEIVEQGEIVHDEDCNFWINEYCDCEARVK